VRRRLLGVAALSAAFVAAGAAPAWAHGLAGRVDLPVPQWLFIYGAATALVISFVALAVLWKEPRLEQADPRSGRDGFLQRLMTGRAVELVVRAVSLGVFLVVVLAALAGGLTTSDNIAPVFVFVWVWVGLAFAHAIFGNLWATLSPFDTLARMLALGDPDAVGREYPPSWGLWPATAGLFAFVWWELVDPWGGSPRALGVGLVTYTAVTLTGMAAYGREAWNRSGEAFAVYFRLLSLISPLGRDGSGRVVLRPVLGGLPTLEPRPGLVAFVITALGSTTFDGFSRSPTWTGWVGSLTGAPRILAGTGGLLTVILLVGGAYLLAMWAASRVSGSRWHPLSVSFAHSLVPIAFAYVLAHYFSYLFITGQMGLRLVSDPFGRGWDLFGTASWRVNQALLSATLIWYVQVAAIVAGHVGGVVLAHDRAIARFPAEVALRTQYALLAVMVLFTITGLLILSG
jgi:hypothetical protein